MNSFIKKFESILELGGIKKDIAFLIISGIALLNILFSHHGLRLFYVGFQLF